MGLRITPREHAFIDLFATFAADLVTGADLLAQILGAAPADRPALYDALQKMEHACDNSTHAIMRRLNQSFITPFDRDDIYALASTLDDCMDYMEAAGEMTVLYAIEEFPERVNEQIAALQRCAELTADVIPRLRAMDRLEEYWIEINRLENIADRAYRALTADLFSNPKYQQTPAGVIELMKLKGVIDTLEGAADSFEHVANTIETICLKES